MTTQRSTLGIACLLTLVVLAGCATLFGGGESTETLTPAPVPEEQTTSASPSAPAAAETTAGTATTGTAVDAGTGTPAGSALIVQPRYLDLRPNCERPPGLVIHIQVSALRNNDPTTDEGINTTWQFAAPSNREVTGPYPNFVELMEENFQPLLDAETVSYGQLFRGNDTASRDVTVTAADGSTQSYRWFVERQSGGLYDGCWMTSSVRPVDDPITIESE